MKIEITEHMTRSKFVEVEFPYYYCHDLSSDFNDYKIYGKLEENLNTVIEETRNDNGVLTYEISKNKISDIQTSGFRSYFDKEFKSTDKKFEAVKKRCVKYLNSF